MINSSLWCRGAQLWHTAFTVDDCLAGVLVTEHCRTCCASAHEMRLVTIIGQGICHICPVSQSETFFPKDVFLFYFDSIDFKSNLGTRYRDGHVAAVQLQKKRNLKGTATTSLFVLLPGTWEKRGVQGKTRGAANLQSMLPFKVVL